MEWKKARKKPVVVEVREVEPKQTFGGSTKLITPTKKGETIETREGRLIAVSGEDYIIRGVEGEIYPISKGIFEKTYEWVESSHPKAVCLVGSTHPQWKKRYRQAEEELTKAGYVVLSVVWFKDDLPNFESHRELLERIHFQKIRLADAVVLIDPQAVGKHTSMEIDFAKKIGKPVEVFTTIEITKRELEESLNNISPKV